MTFPGVRELYEGEGSRTCVSCLVIPPLPLWEKKESHVLCSDCGLWWQAELVLSPGLTTPLLCRSSGILPKTSASHWVEVLEG